MRKFLFGAVMLLLLAGFAQAQDQPLNYLISSTRFQRWYNEQNADSMYAMFGNQMKAAINVSKTKDLIGQLHAQMGKLNKLVPENKNGATLVYRGTFDKSEMNIAYTLNANDEIAGFYLLPPTPKSAPAVNNFNITAAQGFTVNGTLTVPDLPKGKKCNAVLLIAGSGPTDRNGNGQAGLNTNAYKMLADSLKAAGVATVRYDKRGIGESAKGAGTESETSFNDFVDDAAAFVQKIKADKRFADVYVAGHSEGALIALLVAQKEEVAGVISIAGAGFPVDAILKKQIGAQMPDKVPELSRMLSEIKAGKTAVTEDPQLSGMFRASVQPFIRGWMAYDPKTEIAKLKVHTLIIQGTSDVQVSVEDAKNLKAGNKAAMLVIVPNMSHTLKKVSSDPAENQASYTDPEMPLHPEFLKEVITFTRQAHQ